MRKVNDVRRLLITGQRALCEIRPAHDGATGYVLWVHANPGTAAHGQPVARDDGSPMRFADPVGARAKATALGFPRHWIRMARHTGHAA